jgi:hypothetical protein
MRTPEQKKADILKMVNAASAARSAKKVPTCTIRVPVALKARLEAVRSGNETLADVIGRAMLELE